jgi:hypothetical protein
VQTPDEYAAMERYRDRCLGLVVRLDGIVAASTLDRAQHLIDHGEPGIGIEYLAVGITQQAGKVPADIIRDLRELAGGPADLPPNLDDYSD